MDWLGNNESFDLYDSMACDEATPVKFVAILKWLFDMRNKSPDSKERIWL